MRRRQARRALQGMSRRDRKKLAEEASRRRSPLRVAALIFLLALVVLILLQYLF